MNNKWDYSNDNIYEICCACGALKSEDNCTYNNIESIGRCFPWKYSKVGTNFMFLVMGYVCK